MLNVFSSGTKYFIQIFLMLWRHNNYEPLDVQIAKTVFISKFKFKILFARTLFALKI